MLDAVSRLPQERRMAGHFARGDLRAAEVYDAFALDDLREGEL